MFSPLLTSASFFPPFHNIKHKVKKVNQKRSSSSHIRDQLPSALIIITTPSPNGSFLEYDSNNDIFMDSDS